MAVALYNSACEIAGKRVVTVCGVVPDAAVVVVFPTGTALYCCSYLKNVVHSSSSVFLVGVRRECPTSSCVFHNHGTNPSHNPYEVPVEVPPDGVTGGEIENKNNNDDLGDLDYLDRDLSEVPIH